MKSPQLKSLTGFLILLLCSGINTAFAAVNVTPGNTNSTDTVQVGETISRTWKAMATGAGNNSATVVLSWGSSVFGTAGSIRGTKDAQQTFTWTATNAQLGLNAISFSATSTNGGTATATYKFFVPTPVP